jgi:hypothetical protein
VTTAMASSVAAAAVTPTMTATATATATATSAVPRRTHARWRARRPGSASVRRSNAPGWRRTEAW